MRRRLDSPEPQVSAVARTCGVGSRFSVVSHQTKVDASRPQPPMAERHHGILPLCLASPSLPDRHGPFWGPLAAPRIGFCSLCPNISPSVARGGYNAICPDHARTSSIASNDNQTMGGHAANTRPDHSNTTAHRRQARPRASERRPSKSFVI